MLTPCRRADLASAQDIDALPRGERSGGIPPAVWGRGKRDGHMERQFSCIPQCARRR